MLSIPNKAILPGCKGPEEQADETEASSSGNEHSNNPIVLHPLIQILLSHKSGIFAFMTLLDKANQHFLRIAGFWYYKPTCWKHLWEGKNNTQRVTIDSSATLFL